MAGRADTSELCVQCLAAGCEGDEVDLVDECTM